MIIIYCIFFLGLSFGSFINALVWRLHKQSDTRTQKLNPKYSILYGRSMCPNCRHVLGILDLIPVISWLFLIGKCRYCHKPISIMYPLVELLTAGLFIISYLYWPLIFNSQGITYFIIWLILLVGLIALALYDIKYMTLPNRIIYPMFGLVILQIVIKSIFFNKSGYSWLSGDLLGFLIGGGVFYVLFQISKGKWIGGGDVKLGLLLGLYLASGWLAILMIFIASLAGSLVSLPFLFSGKVKRNTHIPYGPFLIIAAIILRLFGTSIISWLKAKGVII